MSVLESLLQFFWSGIAVLQSIYYLLEPNLGLYLGLAAWILFWTAAPNGVRLREIILLKGGAVGLVLLGLIAVLVWGSVSPPTDGYHYILGLQVSNFFGKMIYVTGLICIMMICISIKVVSNPHEPVEAEH